MKTSEKTVTVEVKIGNRTTRRVYPIVSKKGELMTHHLRKLMAGGVKAQRNSRGEEIGTIHFIGMIWKPPYRILQEVIRDRMEKQTELAGLVQRHGELVPLEGLLTVTAAVIPEKADNTKITTLLQHELDLRHQIDLKIGEMKRAAAKKMNPAEADRPAEDGKPADSPADQDTSVNQS